MSNGGKDRRLVGKSARRIVAAGVLLLAAYPPSRLAAQVGYDPNRSPYHDVTTTEALTLFYGRFAGARTNAPVGARPGPMVGGRLEVRLTGALDLWATFAQAKSSRNQVVPSDTINRIRPPIQQTLTDVDLALILNITGAKRWHTLAPYAGMGMGLIKGPGNQTDPGGFRVGSNFFIAPTIGTRVYLSKALGLRFEARDYWLRYEWPLAYYQPTDANNHPVTPVLDQRLSTRQVTHNFTLTAGLSYHFTF